MITMITMITVITIGWPTRADPHTRNPLDRKSGDTCVLDITPINVHVIHMICI